MKAASKPVEIFTKLNEMAGYAPDEEIDLYEVRFPSHNCFFFLISIASFFKNCMRVMDLNESE